MTPNVAAASQAQLVYQAPQRTVGHGSGVDPAIIVYTVSGSSECRELKTWLKQLGVRFAEYPILSPTGAGRFEPLTILGGRVLSGSVADQRKAISEALAMTSMG